MLSKDKSELQNFANAVRQEWLETNGLGGWTGSSIIGAHTRRYHGLLVAAIEPPTGRVVLVSKLDETIVTNESRIELGANLYPGNVIHPRGHQYLECFNREIFPEWYYQADGIRLKKTVAMIHGENTVIIRYEVLEAKRSFKMEFLPLVAARGYHSLAYEGPQMHWDADFKDGIFHNRPDGKTDIFIYIPESSYQHQPRWFHSFQYREEQYRGLDYNEDLFNHGVFSVTLEEGDSLGIILSTENPAGRNAYDLLSKESIRRNLLLRDQPESDLIRSLVLAADQFVVKRFIRPAVDLQNNTSKGDPREAATIIAGYHWFTDWARDTMISLPGLCLSTGRFEEARKILSAFAASADRGMLPNRFQDHGDKPEYNNVDGTLWYFISVHKYLEATNDKEFVLKEILPVLKDIIDWHFRGTRYSIRVDADGLLYSGEHGQQLTWMDARIDDWVVTPRMGKPVEIQALWYNALKVFAGLLNLNEQEHDAFKVNLTAEKAKDSFIRKFWFQEGNYLYDTIDENGVPDSSLRPNQLLAISLPYAMIEGEKAAAIVKLVKEKLYTPVGLRSLSADDNRYVPLYGGDQWHRDAAYHQGTVWSWLLGPYIDALIKVNGDQDEAKRVIDDFAFHLHEGCIGSVSEIFDGEAPHHPGGCVAQAWGVAEILRAIKEHNLFIKENAPESTIPDHEPMSIV